MSSSESDNNIDEFVDDDSDNYEPIDSDTSSDDENTPFIEEPSPGSRFVYIVIE